MWFRTMWVARDALRSHVHPVKWVTDKQSGQEVHIPNKSCVNA